MNSRERRQYEMLGLVREFWNTNRGLFTKSTVAQEMFAGSQWHTKRGPASILLPGPALPF